MSAYTCTDADAFLVELDLLVPLRSDVPDVAQVVAIVDLIQRGVPLPPIWIRPQRDDGRFLMIEGRHRLAASRKLGFTHIPALVTAAPAWHLQRHKRHSIASSPLLRSHQTKKIVSA